MYTELMTATERYTRDACAAHDVSRDALLEDLLAIGMLVRAVDDRLHKSEPLLALVSDAITRDVKALRSDMASGHADRWDMAHTDRLSRVG